MDIYSPRGRRAVEIAREKLGELQERLNVKFIPFCDDYPSPYDGVVVRDDFIRAAYEVRTRNASIKDGKLLFWGKPHDTLMVTADKIDRCVKVAASVYLPFHLIIVFTNRVLMWQVSDNNGNWLLGDIERKKTRSRKTINGGTCTRENYFIPLSKAKTLC